MFSAPCSATTSIWTSTASTRTGRPAISTPSSTSTQLTTSERRSSTPASGPASTTASLALPESRWAPTSPTTTSSTRSNPPSRKRRPPGTAAGFALSGIRRRFARRNPGSFRPRYSRRVALQLRPMQDEEFEAWLPLLQEEYAQELVRDYGRSADTARARAVVEIDGHRPVTHSVVVVEVGGARPVTHWGLVIGGDGEAVGHLWLVERRDDFEPTLSVYDIDIDEL